MTTSVPLCACGHHAGYRISWSHTKGRYHILPGRGMCLLCATQQAAKKNSALRAQKKGTRS